MSRPTRSSRRGLSASDAERAMPRASAYSARDVKPNARRVSSLGEGQAGSQPPRGAGPVAGRARSRRSSRGRGARVRDLGPPRRRTRQVSAAVRVEPRARTRRHLAAPGSPLRVSRPRSARRISRAQTRRSGEARSRWDRASARMRTRPRLHAAESAADARALEGRGGVRRSKHPRSRSLGWHRHPGRRRR
jgi:hypothetical protein